MIRLSLLLIFGIVSLGFSQVKYSAYSIPKEFTTNANSVIVDENITIDVSEVGIKNIKTKRVTTVLNKAGFKDARCYAGYDKTTKIKKLEAFIYNAYGVEIKHIKKKGFVDISAVSDISIYEDHRVKYLSYTPTQYPFTIVFVSETEDNSTGFIPSWYPINNYSSSVISSKYTLLFSPENKPRMRTKNVEGFGIEISETPTKFVCLAKKLKPIKFEKYAPSITKIVPSVSFALNHFSLKGVRGYASNWKEFGAWMQNQLLSKTGKLPEATISEIKNLTAGYPTNIEKARVVYDYLQKKVRYVSIQVGIGGWKPMQLEDVDKLSYGDCKALTNYTKAMLDAVGIPSYYTLLYAGDEEISIDKDFARIEGNHAMLGIPDNNEIIWLECTSQTNPFGYNGNFTDNRDVLAITPEGGKIVHTTTYPLNKNKQLTNASIILESTGSLSALLTTQYTGLKYDDVYYLSKKEKDFIENHYKEKWSYLNGLSLQKTNFTDDRESITFTENIQLNVTNYCSKIGGNLLLAPNVFNRKTTIPPSIKNRKQKIEVIKEFIEEDSLTFTLPDGYKIEKSPKETTITNKFGTYQIQFKTTNNTLTYYRKYIQKKGIFPAIDYQEFRDFKKKIVKLDKLKILVIQTQKQ